MASTDTHTSWHTLIPHGCGLWEMVMVDFNSSGGQAKCIGRFAISTTRDFFLLTPTYRTKRRLWLIYLSYMLHGEFFLFGINELRHVVLLSSWVHGESMVFHSSFMSWWSRAEVNLVRLVRFSALSCKHPVNNFRCTMVPTGSRCTMWLIGPQTWNANKNVELTQPCVFIRFPLFCYR